MLQKDCILVEGLQRRETKLNPELSNLENEERLRQLKLSSMSYRSAGGGMIEVYNHHLHHTSGLLPRDEPKIRRGHVECKLKKVVLQNSIKATFVSAFAWWIRGMHSEHEWFLHQTWIVLKLDWTMPGHITFKAMQGTHSHC